MIQAYTIDSIHEQVSSKSLVILDASLFQKHQSEDNPAEATTPWVIEAARGYIQYSSFNTDGDETHLIRLRSGEMKDKTINADVIVCAFDASIQSLLSVVMSENPFPDNGSLIRLLDAEVWTYLASAQVLDMSSTYDLRIFSDNTYTSLTDFQAVLERFAENNVANQMQDIGAIEETIFWRRMMKTRRSSRVPAPNYTLASGGQPSEIGPTYANHTFPRRRARLPLQRPRSQSESADLSIPRTMPFDRPENTDKYTRYTSHYGSETSNSTGDGNRR